MLVFVKTKISGVTFYTRAHYHRPDLTLDTLQEPLNVFSSKHDFYHHTLKTHTHKLKQCPLEREKNQHHYNVPFSYKRATCH